MSRLSQVNVNEATGKTAELFTAIKKAAGRVPNAYATIGTHSPAALGAVFVVYLLGMVSSPMAARLANSIGRRSTLGVAACMGASGMLLTLLPSLVGFIAGLGLLAAAVFVEQTLSIGFVSIATERAKSTAVGLYVTCYYIGGSLGGIVPAGIWHRAGWPGCVALIVLSQASMLLIASMAWSERGPGSALRAMRPSSLPKDKKI